MLMPLRPALALVGPWLSQASPPPGAKFFCLKMTPFSEEGSLRISAALGPR